MMGRALLIVGWIATLGFLAAGISGYRLEGDPELLQVHLLLGLASVLLLLFSHCWIMFYLIGTGKAIKVTVAENGLEGNLVQRTKVFKNRSYPWLLLAMGLAMATFIVGGGVFTGVLPPWMHHSLFLLGLAAQIWTLIREGSILAANERLMAEIERRITGSGPGPPV